ncbi:hypothetical protein Ocin01_16886 [Orchesella cincta]|uniref:Uncharacterized protein n=1 Tax=Orchesella cincta TaxID=48709 RepID=A0A1D2M9Y4_ORCCI|nr:hypothetical protein Ocin01_16886 [Orchesella cincta]
MPPKLLGILISVALSLLLDFTAADLPDGIYPDVTNCFKGYSRDAEEEATNHNKYLQDDCKQMNPEEPLVCLKFCMVSRQEMLWESGQEDGTTTQFGRCMRHLMLQTFGISDWNNPKNYLEPEKTRVTELVAKCLDSSFIVPHDEMVECKDLAPKHQESLEKLIDCLEDAFKC